MRRSALLLFLLWLTAAGASPVRAASRIAPEQFLISFWCGPPPEETTLARYREIADAGFNTVLPPCSGPITLGLDQQILQFCAQVGLKAIISDPRLDAARVAAPGAADFGATLDGVVRDYAASPALLGYFLRDEPAAAEFPRLAEVSRGLEARDPGHLSYINLFPSYATAAQLGMPTYSEYVNGFLQTVHPPLLSYDHYALLTSGERPDYFVNLETIRREALQAGIPFADILLVTPHGPYRDPSEADLRWQVYTALAYGARGILYFTYWTPHYGSVPFYDAILDDQGRRTAHYAEVQRLNGELNALGPLLAQLRSTGVYHSGALPDGTQGVSGDNFVQAVEGGDAVIGLFAGPPPTLGGSGTALPQAGSYLLMTNRDPRRAATLRVTMRADVSSIAEISRSTGQAGPPWGPDGYSGHRFTLNLAPGDGRLFALLTR